MKIFLDANVLVSVLNKEFPLFATSARILSLTDSSSVQVYTSPICLAIAYYFAEKKSGTKLANQKLRILASKIKIASTDKKSVEQVLSNQRVEDFEDGLEYYSAVNSGCKAIITENVADFYFSEIPVLPCEQFLHGYVTKSLKF